MRARYKMLEEDRRGSGGPVAHRDTPEVVGVEDCCRNWSRLHRFRRGTAKRNGGFRAIETSPPRFNPLGDPRHRGRALGNTAEPRAASNDGNRTWPELGFAVVCRWEREREKRERDLGLQRRRSSFYRRRGWWPSSGESTGMDGVPGATELLGSR
jgi:hypothetical protein